MLGLHSTEKSIHAERMIDILMASSKATILGFLHRRGFAHVTILGHYALKQYSYMKSAETMTLPRSTRNLVTYADYLVVQQPPTTCTRVEAKQLVTSGQDYIALAVTKVMASIESRNSRQPDHNFRTGLTTAQSS